MKYYIIAGEASGDLHGSNLIKGLRSADPDCRIKFWGGDLMAEAAGTQPVVHYRDNAVMGFIEVLMNARRLLRSISFCRKDIIGFNPDAVILIDYPGFNFRIAEFAKKRGFRVYYYIAPKVWAWKEKRVERLKKYVDRLFIIFPFEKEYFRSKGIDAIYEGNPLTDRITESASEENRKKLHEESGIPEGIPTVALLAGSRKMEINYLLPRMMETVRSRPELHFILAAAPSVDRKVYERMTGGKDRPSNLSIQYGKTYSVLAGCDAAIISSGTASLEAALIGVPQAVCYGGNEISYRIARHFIKVKYISLANLILDRQIFRELIQHECTPACISEELDRLLYDTEYTAKMKKDYDDVRKALSGEGPGASARVGMRMYRTAAGME